MVHQGTQGVSGQRSHITMGTIGEYIVNGSVLASQPWGHTELIQRGRIIKALDRKPDPIPALPLTS